MKDIDDNLKCAAPWCNRDAKALMFAPTHVSATCLICGGVWNPPPHDVLDRYVPIVEFASSLSSSVEHKDVHDDAPDPASASGAAQERCGDA